MNPFRVSLEKLYREEVRMETEKQAGVSFPVISESSISGLPEPVQRHIRTCGFIGRRGMKHVRMIWESAYIRMSRHKHWMPMRCYQFNSVPEPVRIVYMKSLIAGIFPFEGRDKYQSGHGNMLITLLKIFRITDVRGRKMNESALVTVLAETFLAPSYALQDYIRWEPVDANRAKATLTFNHTCVSGMFHFSDSGLFVRFDTDARWRDEKDLSPVKWSALAGAYKTVNGIRFPAELRAVWHDSEGDFEYFRGTIDRPEYEIQ